MKFIFLKKFRLGNYVIILSSLITVLILPLCCKAQDLREVEITIPKGSTSKLKTIFCSGNTPGSGKTIAGEVVFTSFAEVIQKLKKKKAKESKLKEFKTMLKTGKSECRKLPATSPPPTATPPPSGNTNFDVFGNVTEKGKQAFGIPSNLNANITQGKNVYTSFCTGCHEEKRSKSFSALRTLIAQSPMLYDQEQMPDTYLANLTAYLNRFSQ